MDKLKLVKMALESAAVISVASYFFQKYFAEPRQALEKLVTEVDADLVFFANRWANPTDANSARGLEAQDTFRGHAASIRAAIRGIGFVRKWFLCGLPTPGEFKESSELLIRISNSIIVPQEEKGEAAKRNRDAEARIRTLLRIPDGG